MPVCIEDECNSELPPASLLFRAARQYAYGVLFSLAETHRRLERLSLRKRTSLEGGCRAQTEEREWFCLRHSSCMCSSFLNEA